MSFWSYLSHFYSDFGVLYAKITGKHRSFVTRSKSSGNQLFVFMGKTKNVAEISTRIRRGLKRHEKSDSNRPNLCLNLNNFIWSVKRSVKATFWCNSQLSGPKIVFAMPKNLTEANRNKIVGMVEAGMSMSKVMKVMGVSRVTVWALMKKNRQRNGDLSDLPRSGRPRTKVTQQNRDKLGHLDYSVWDRLASTICSTAAQNRQELVRRLEDCWHEVLTWRRPALGQRRLLGVVKAGGGSSRLAATT
jgi:hypothetical protein